MPTVPEAPAQTAGEIRTAVEEFLASAKQPALYEPGEDLLPLTDGNFLLEMRGSRLTLQAWDRTRNLTRRVQSVRKRERARIELSVERFGRREGPLYLVDLLRRAGADAGLRSARLVFRERFRLLLRRQFPAWTLAELSAEADLAHSLSPSYPRAFLRHGTHGWAAIASPPGADAAGALSFGLIWLSYLRQREKRVAVEGLAVYAPEGREGSVALRMLYLDPSAAQFNLFAYSENDYVARVDLKDHGNLSTRLELSGDEPRDWGAWERIVGLPGVERVPRPGGRVSLRVRGIEFAEWRNGELRFGIGDRRPADVGHLPEIERLAAELERLRSPRTTDRNHPAYRQAPEAWLESRVRAEIETVDASLLPGYIYGQTPVFTGGERGVIDLLAADRSGRLAALELKASADLHLPLQALDYWIHVKWLLERGAFTPAGYFPGMELRREPPRLLLVSPSLEFHPTTEVILNYFSPLVDVERIGLAVEWRQELRVVFRLAGARRPD